jgi:heme-degrading monooxygenase HmoA
MIARHWCGWTRRENAEAYENFLRHRIFPELETIEGYRGGQLLRHDDGAETEFIVLNLFESLEAVKRFAGEQYATAVIEPEAKRLLMRWEETAEHYEVRATIKIKEEADG